MLNHHEWLLNPTPFTTQKNSKLSVKQFEPSFHVFPMPRLKTSNGAPTLVTKGVPLVLSVTKYAGVGGATAAAAVLVVLLVLLVLLSLLVVVVVESAPSNSEPWRRIRNSRGCFFLQNMGPGGTRAKTWLVIFGSVAVAGSRGSSIHKQCFHHKHH